MCSREADWWTYVRPWFTGAGALFHSHSREKSVPQISFTTKFLPFIQGDTEVDENGRAVPVDPMLTLG